MKYEVVADACRICLRKSRSCRSIFKPYDNECMAPSEKLKLVSGVNVIQEDKDFPALPQLICRTCEVSLNMAFSLRNRARKSDHIIHIYCNRLNKDNIIVELDTGRKFKLPKELTLRVVRKSTHPTFCSPQTSTEEINLSDLEESFEKTHSDFDSALNSCDEIEMEEHEKENLIEDEEFVEERIEVCSKDNIYSTHDEEIKDHKSYSQSKSADEDIVYIKQENEQEQEVKPVYNAIEIAKRLDASDKYEVVSWKQENEGDSVPVFKLRLKGVETKQLSNDFICEVCGNTYRQKHRLTEHVRRHSNERRYACEICNKRFAIAEGLRRHVLTHGANKPFKCNYCTRRFYNPSARKAHEIVHSGVKPYNCNICNRAFAYTCSLRKHMLIHENRKLYRCEYCNKEFRLQHHLKQHEETQIHKDTVAEHTNLQMSSVTVLSTA